MRHTVDLEYDLTQVQLGTGQRQSTTDLIGESLAELATLLAQCFVADHETSEGQHLLHHTQVEREAEI